jgi:hypothetical protein
MGDPSASHWQPLNANRFTTIGGQAGRTISHTGGPSSTNGRLCGGISSALAVDARFRHI